MKLRFDELQTFVTVVDSGGFIAAAQSMGIAKSAVSRRITELEDKLAAQLINRTTRSFGLTDIGTEFYKKARKILDELESAELVAKEESHLSGKLRVSGPMSFGSLHLAPLLGEFLELHPGLTVELDLNDRFADLANDGFDLAVRVSRFEDSSLIARKIADIHHVAVASPKYLARFGLPKTPKELSKHRGISYSNVSDNRYWQFSAKTKFQTVRANEIECKLKVNNGDAIREAAVAGYGIAVLPSFIVHREIKSGRLEVILRAFERPPIHLYAVYSSKRNLSPKVRKFIDFLVKKFNGNPYWDNDISGKR